MRIEFIKNGCASMVAGAMALGAVTAAQAQEVYFKIGKAIPFEEVEFVTKIADPALRPVYEGEYTERSDCGVATIGGQVFEFSFDDLYDGSLVVALEDISNDGKTVLDDEYSPKCPN